MRVTLTGSRGFLGTHVRAALRESATPYTEMRVGARFDDAGNATAASSNRFIHIAGVNRGSDAEVEDGNVLFAKQAADAIRSTSTPPQQIVFANSVQAANGSVYGEAKRKAGAVLASVAGEVGAEFIDLQLPNLFGEHGRPFYNAVTATFCHLLAEGQSPVIENDKPLQLLHAQDAADLLTGWTALQRLPNLVVEETVGSLLDRLRNISGTYSAGEIPDVATPFARNLFNTYRSYTFPAQSPVRLARHADERGSFFEVVRAHGGPSQSSFSTTQPGITRGDHFHRRKIERFTVLSGRGVIRLRRLFTDEVVSFQVDGETPMAIDMPTLWAHSIQNVGHEPLFTSFWTNDIFDPSAPDTIPEAVLQ